MMMMMMIFNIRQIDSTMIETQRKKRKYSKDSNHFKCALNININEL